MQKRRKLPQIKQRLFFIGIVLFIIMISNYKACFWEKEAKINISQAQEAVIESDVEVAETEASDSVLLQAELLAVFEMDKLQRDKRALELETRSKSYLVTLPSSSKSAEAETVSVAIQPSKDSPNDSLALNSQALIGSKDSSDVDVKDLIHKSVNQDDLPLRVIHLVSSITDPQNTNSERLDQQLSCLSPTCLQSPLPKESSFYLSIETSSNVPSPRPFKSPLHVVQEECQSTVSLTASTRTSLLSEKDKSVSRTSLVTSDSMNSLNSTDVSPRRLSLGRCVSAGISSVSLKKDPMKIKTSSSALSIFLQPEQQIAREVNDPCKISN